MNGNVSVAGSWNVAAASGAGPGPRRRLPHSRRETPGPRAEAGCTGYRRQLHPGYLRPHDGARCFGGQHRLRSSRSWWAIRAERGDGIAGSFVFTSKQCKSPTNCTLYGDFTSDDGLTSRDEVLWLDDAPDGVNVGGACEANAARTVLRETPNTRAIILIGNPSARRNRRISAQSSTDNTPPPPSSHEPGELTRGQNSTGDTGSAFTGADR